MIDYSCNSYFIYEIQLFEAEHVRVFIFQRYSINILKTLYSELLDFKHLQREEGGGKREKKNKQNNKTNVKLYFIILSYK